MQNAARGEALYTTVVWTRMVDGSLSVWAKVPALVHKERFSCAGFTVASSTPDQASISDGAFCLVYKTIFAPCETGVSLHAAQVKLDARRQVDNTNCAAAKQLADTLFPLWAGRFVRASKFCPASGSISAAGASVRASDLEDSISALAAGARPGSPAGSAPCTTINLSGPTAGNTIGRCLRGVAAPTSVCWLS